MAPVVISHFGLRLPQYVAGGEPRLLALNRHRFQRIIEFCAAVTTHAICPPADGEDTAEIAVTTAKQKVEELCDVRHKTSHGVRHCGRCTSNAEPDDG